MKMSLENWLVAGLFMICLLGIVAPLVAKLMGA